MIMTSLGSFFDAADCSSSSDDEPTTPEKIKDVPKDSLAKANDDKLTKLPSPTSLLRNVQRPGFLKSADEQAKRDLIAEKRDQLDRDRENSTGAFAPKVPVGEIPTKPLNPSATLSSRPLMYTHSTDQNTVHAGENDGSPPVASKRRNQNDSESTASTAKKVKQADS